MFVFHGFILSCTLRQLFSQLHCFIFLHFSKILRLVPSISHFRGTFMVIIPTWTFFHVQFLHSNEQYFSESDVLLLLWFLGSFPSPFSDLKNSPKFRFCSRLDCPDLKTVPNSKILTFIHILNLLSIAINITPCLIQFRFEFDIFLFQKTNFIHSFSFQTLSQIKR